MKSTSRFFIMAAMILTTACSTASAATDNLCERPTKFIQIEQDMGMSPFKRRIMPDTGTYPGPNGESLPNKWLDLRKENPQTLTLHCFYDNDKTDKMDIPINNAKSCTWTPDGKVTCN